MTVKELIAVLREYPEYLDVLVELEGGFDIVTAVRPMMGVEVSGYVSEAYRDQDREKAKPYVYIR